MRQGNACTPKASLCQKRGAGVLEPWVGLGLTVVGSSFIPGKPSAGFAPRLLPKTGLQDAEAGGSQHKAPLCSTPLRDRHRAPAGPALPCRCRRSADRHNPATHGPDHPGGAGGANPPSWGEPGNDGYRSYDPKKTLF